MDRFTALVLQCGQCGHTGHHRGTEPRLTEDRSLGGGWRGEVGPASTLRSQTLHSVYTGQYSVSHPYTASFCRMIVLTFWYQNQQKCYTREEVANLAMAVANLLVSCPLDGKVDTFSM